MECVTIFKNILFSKRQENPFRHYWEVRKYPKYVTYEDILVEVNRIKMRKEDGIEVKYDAPALSIILFVLKEDVHLMRVLNHYVSTLFYIKD